MRLGVEAKPCGSVKPGDAFCFTDVPHQPRVVLTFDRLMAPSSVFRENYRIVSGSSPNLNFKQVRVDPIERAVVFTIREDQKLLPGVEYLLRIKSVEDPANRIAAFDGARFEGETIVRFSTGMMPGTAEGEIDPSIAGEPATANERACAVLERFQATCAGSTCHGGITAATEPAMGLSLISNDSVKATAKGHAATLVQAADDPAGVGRTTTDFPTGLPLIPSPSLGDGSARSFLFYKVLMDVRPRSACEPANSACSSENAYFLSLGKELSKRIPGTAMPHATQLPDPSATSAFSPWTPAEVRLLRRWIDEDAPPCSKTGAPTDAGVDATPETGADAASDAADGG